MVNLSPAYEPVLIKGLKVHPENPFLFDFIIDTGNSDLDSQDARLKSESNKLIKYFLASLTVPEKDLWVNLSPYEKDRMIAPNLGQTVMGRDMLAQDYILKQLTASLIYPEKHLGKTFWDEVYTKARQMYGTTEIPVNTFNKVWIVADRADVFEKGNVAYVVGAHLKVMLEEDYMALSDHVIPAKGRINRHSQLLAGIQNTHTIASQIIRQIILPQIEKEVNTGKNFAPLRQMFYSMILSSWYKMALKDAILTQIYGNQSKVKVGVNQDDPKTNEEIFQRYLKAYKKGVFNYIKDDIDQVTREATPRKYFSGGEDMAMLPHTVRIVKDLPEGFSLSSHIVLETVDTAPEKKQDPAMLSLVEPFFARDLDEAGFRSLINGLNAAELNRYYRELKEMIADKANERWHQKAAHYLEEVKKVWAQKMDAFVFYFDLSNDAQNDIFPYLSTERRIEIYLNLLDRNNLRKGLNSVDFRLRLREVGFQIYPIMDNFGAIFTGEQLVFYYGNELNNETKRMLTWEETAPYVHNIGGQSWKREEAIEKIYMPTINILIITQSGKDVALINLKTLHQNLERNAAMSSAVIKPIGQGENVSIDGEVLPAVDVERAILSMRATEKIKRDVQANNDFVLLVVKAGLPKNQVTAIRLLANHYNRMPPVELGNRMAILSAGNEKVLKAKIPPFRVWLDEREAEIPDIYKRVQAVDQNQNGDGAPTEPDKAMGATIDPVGGIDLNRFNMLLNVHKDGQGVRMQFDPSMVTRILHDGFDGLDFQIQSIIPISNLPQLLGLKHLNTIE